MGWKVVYSASSHKDLQRIVKYVAQHDLNAAGRLGSRLIELADALAAAPKMGVAIEGRSQRRIFPSPPYLIIYRVHSRRREVRVLRFWHASRGRLPLKRAAQQAGERRSEKSSPPLV